MRVRSWLGIIAFVALIPLLSAAQKPPEYITATAVGQGVNIGRDFQVQIAIRAYSTSEETQVLREALKSNGLEGLSNALQRMKSHGNISMPRTTGYEISYVRIYDTPNGKVIRMVTNRKFSPGEGWTDRVSTDYPLTAFEVNISKNGKCTGTMYSSAKVSLSTEGRITVEPYETPWTLVNIDVR